jgi:hypothetical protein
MASIQVSLLLSLYFTKLTWHLGQNQAEVIMKVINDYGIASKVGYFMMDNASNNDTMMKALSTSSYNLSLRLECLLIIIL